jgi:SAM-dependent methyltransferase
MAGARHASRSSWDIAMASRAQAFDLVASGYDRGFGRNPAGRVFRYVFQELLLGAFPAGARLLDLGCGTGEDALFLASRGRRVVGVDASPLMVEEARARAAGRAGVGFEVGRIEELAAFGDGFDGAYSDFGALNCADLKAVGRGLARALRPGAPLLLSVMGPRPLPLLLERLLAGRGEPRGDSLPDARAGPARLRPGVPLDGRARARRAAARPRARRLAGAPPAGLRAAGGLRGLAAGLAAAAHARRPQPHRRPAAMSTARSGWARRRVARAA